MLFPRFTLRTILAVTTVAAVFFLLVGTGYRGQQWAWAAAIGIGSLGLTIVVQVFCFVFVKSIAKCVAWLTSTRDQRTLGNSAELEATT
jgi:hypothetical protein